jgi:uncharacterized protein
MTWEANLMVAIVSILVLMGGALGVAFGILPIMIATQLLVILPGLLWIAARRLPFRATLRLYPVGWQTAVWSALVGLVCWPVVAGMSTLVEQGLSLIGPGTEIPRPAGIVESLIYAVVLIFLAPITEEPIFRGFVLRAWLRRGTALGLVMTGVLFASFHFQLASLIPLTFLGVSLGLLALHSNSLFSSLIAHICYNTIGTLFLVIPSLYETSDWLIIGAGIIATPLAIMLLWAFTRRFPVPAEALLPRETSSWVWTTLSLLVALGIGGLIAIGEIILRLSPNLAGG